MAGFVKKALFCGLAFAALLAGCSDKAPTPDERLVAAYVEIRLVEQNYGENSPNVRLARRGILEKYGYTRESFAEACDKVLNDETLWVPFQTAVTDRIDSLLGIPKPVKEDPKKKKKGEKK